MSLSETVTWIISGSALVISIASFVVSKRHNKRILDQNEAFLRLEQTKVDSELGTLADIGRKKKLLREEYEETRKVIQGKWDKALRNKGAELAARGLSQSGVAKNEINELKKKRELELKQEKRKYDSTVQDLGSREKIIREYTENK
ncbi:MAG: hypothetical protein H8E46_05575 [FCB group bacterium]|nr:hypothetical protein [FCB group bacterium]